MVWSGICGNSCGGVVTGDDATSLTTLENWRVIPGTYREEGELRRGKWFSKGKEEQTTECLRTNNSRD